MPRKNPIMRRRQFWDSLYVVVYWLACTVAVPLAALGADSTRANAPTAPGGIVAWIVCNARKRRPVGGWLMFFYWQIYSGLLVSAVMFASNIQSYVPENFDSTSKFALFLSSALPSVLLFVVKCAVATLLLSARTWGMLPLLRGVLMADL